MTRRVPLDVDGARLVFGVCPSCGVMPSPDGTICHLCAACPSVVTGPEHISTILPRVMADLLTRSPHEVPHRG